ncbi:CoA transferase [Arsenicitalea aurantiaca]|uniref:CoA transferase n=2 Tax=Arsenicitalea aurantiaca TaxID=1783274 RepID=A0A433XL82_9HYPH|nr:CoA transferase [Arsenicitalea aurantiaca]
MEKQMSSVLSGYKIIDCTIAMAGPFAAQRLGDLGADVIKVEPTTGEWQRHVSAGGAEGKRINVSFTVLNRNKRSLAVNLKTDEGRAVLFDLVKAGDVFIQNYRPGVAKRLGVDYESLKAINPKIIYVSMSGYGEDGPYVNYPGQDMLLQAMSGAMYNVGRKGEAPLPSGNYLVDAVTAYSAFEGVLAALLHRERTGEGQKVEVNMLDSIIALQMQELSIYTVGGIPQERSSEPDGHVYIRAPYGVFNTADGAVALAFPPLKTFGRVADIPEFLEMEDGRDSFARKDLIIAKTREALLRKTTAEWLALFREADIWSGPVYGYADLLEDPQVAHNGSLIEYDHPTEGRIKTPGFPYKFSATPCAIRHGAPLVGQHSAEVLGELGYDEQRIDALMKAGVIASEKV